MHVVVNQEFAILSRKTYIIILGFNIDVFQGCIDSIVDIGTEVKDTALQWSRGCPFSAVEYCKPTGYAVAAQFVPVWFYIRKIQ